MATAFFDKIRFWCLHENGYWFVVIVIHWSVGVYETNAWINFTRRCLVIGRKEHIESIGSQTKTYLCATQPAMSYLMHLKLNGNRHLFTGRKTQLVLSGLPDIYRLLTDYFSQRRQSLPSHIIKKKSFQL